MHEHPGLDQYGVARFASAPSLHHFFPFHLSVSRSLHSSAQMGDADLELSKGQGHFVAGCNEELMSCSDELWSLRLRFCRMSAVGGMLQLVGLRQAEGKKAPFNRQASLTSSSLEAV